jgi:alkaline phosphatase
MRVLITVLAALVASSVAIATGPVSEREWRENGQLALHAAQKRRPNLRRAKNVIVFLGDGMSIATINAARIYEGQQRGDMGEENLLSFERLPYSGLVKTYNTDAMVPDSAGTMSAIMTGVKTRAGVISVAPSVFYQQCDGANAHRVETALEIAERQGKATGVVTTARLTHATPAATYAHSADREWENDSKLNASAREKGCLDIARQLIQFNHGDGIEVALGGGRENFLGNAQNDPEYPHKTGARVDQDDLTKAWRQRNPQGHYVWNRDQFLALDLKNTQRVLGLFEPSHMRYEAERGEGNEPSLSEMTRTAISLLQKNKKGFFLMVEGGRIDHAHHGGNARNALNETVEFARAVQVALEMTQERDTLIVVTADHGHTLSLAGDDVRRGNPILGLAQGFESENGDYTIQKDLNGKPFAILNYINGPGFGVLSAPPKVDYVRPDLSAIDTSAWPHRQEALIPLKSETHSGEDVSVYARGPWSHLFTGTLEQHALFYFYQFALYGK